ncbi:hypothetical protein [Actinomadura roseirufa]|uniref:hypothetical protein n=1 Tax=Actinomadura roseirufa TaxID=2094049 RepID=UPI001041B4DB|nr:hypothetical protein [Actinomadura roseirufa]
MRFPSRGWRCRAEDGSGPAAAAITIVRRGERRGERPGRRRGAGGRTDRRRFLAGWFSPRRTAALAAGLLLAAAGCTADSGDDPKPGGPAQARRTARPAQPFGLKWNGYEHDARYDGVIDSYRGGGTFHDITWCGVERVRGERRWDAEDKVVDDALRHGYELLVRIRIGSCWASGRPDAPAPRTSPSYPPADLNAYRAFAGDLASRYAARGVHLFAIENEIDTANHWGADPAAYPAVARAGAEAVRRADPRARLTDSGLSSSGYGIAVAEALRAAGRRDEALRFYREFGVRRGGERFPEAHDDGGLRAAFTTPAAARALAAHKANFGLDRDRVFDIVQLHYYDPWRLAGQVVDYIRRAVPAGTPIEAWEAGSFWPGQRYDPAAHARETAQLATDLLARGVRRVVYLPLFYSPGAVAPQETWRALYTRDGTARPAAAVLEKLRDATRTGTWRPYEGHGLRGAAVGLHRETDDSTTLVLWSADGTSQTLTAPSAGGTELTPLPGGRTRTWNAGTVTVGADPVIISTRLPVTAALDWLNGNAR